MEVNIKIVVKCIAGSHLFGTNTETSDKDYKGIFLPTAREILLGNYKDARSSSTGPEHSKNSVEDIDVELYSIKKFFKMIQKGDTAALELLFTPEEMILEKSPIWDKIVSHRDKLLSSQVTAIIGYARQQSNKYGIKGSRMGELSNCIKAMKEVHKDLGFDNAKLKHGWEQLTEKLKGFEHVEFIELEVSANMERNKVPALNILGKKFDHHIGFTHVLEILKKIYKNYGHRAREAKNNNGVDWKALSHATRVSVQGLELLRTGKITLPLNKSDRNLVKSIKIGSIDYKEVGKIIEDHLVLLEKARLESDLQEKVSQEFIDDLIYEIHLGAIK